MKVDTVKIGDEKSGVTNGRAWKLTQVGVKIGDKWYNGAVFKDSDLELFRACESGGDLPIRTYKEEYKGKFYDKFKLVSPLEALEQRIARLEKMANISPDKGEEKEPEDLNRPGDDLPF